MTGEGMMIVFALLLFAVAFLYASVGHGGASGYLALMALFSFSPMVMKPSALILNIFVSFISFYQYYKGGHFRWKLFFPFIITSIPAAFIGAYVNIDPLIYKKVLGAVLVFPILRLLGFFGKESELIKDVQLTWALLIGAVIGFLSGMIGIGGGIILSPVILLMGWGNMKQTAAVSALFIFINSVSGLGGLLIKGVSIDNTVFIWLLIAVAGGFSGARLAKDKFSNKTLKAILATVLTIASVKLFLTGK